MRKLDLRGSLQNTFYLLIIALIFGAAFFAGCKSDSGDDKNGDGENSDDTGNTSQSLCMECLQEKCDAVEQCAQTEGCIDYVNCLVDCADGSCEIETSCASDETIDADGMVTVSEMSICMYTVCASECVTDEIEMPKDAGEGTDTSEGEQCDSEIKTRCVLWMVEAYNSCGYRETIEECDDSSYCDDGECLPCESHASRACDGNTVIWRNGCGIDEGVAEECGEKQQCDSGECVDCKPHAEKVCGDNKELYWQDSCGNVEELDTICGEDQRCVWGECNDCISMHHMDCDGRDVRWFDSCGRPEEVVETCAENLFCVEGECETYPNKCACDCECEGVENTIIALTCEARACNPTCDENCAFYCEENYQSAVTSATGECH